MRILPLVGSLATLLALASSVEAAPITFTTAKPRRYPDSELGRPFDATNAGGVIRRSDCETDSGVIFIVTSATALTSDLQAMQVWARKDSNIGTSCAAAGERVGTGVAGTQGCRLVIQFSLAQMRDQKELRIPARNIIAAAYNDLDVSTSIEASKYSALPLDAATTCKPRNTMTIGSGPTITPNLQLSFLLIDSRDQVLGGDGSETIWKAVFDIAGPAAPTSLSMAGGNQQLFASFSTEVTDTTLKGFKVYCVKTGRKWSGPSTATKGVDGALDGDETEAGDDTGASDTATDSAEAGETSTDTGSTEIDAGSSASCGDTSGLLAVGKYPTADLDKYVCGESTQIIGSSRIQLKSVGGAPLENDTYYAIAVSGTDVHGNTGPLSEIGCEAPGATTDFWDAYRGAGGKGGGGYCAYGGGSAPVLGVVGLLAGLSILGRRRGRAR